MAWLHIEYYSETLRMPVPMEVLLPQHGGPRGTASPGPYAALYLLHGRTDNQTAWLRRTSVERYVEGLPLAVVMPAAHLSWYTDMACGRDYFQFITRELPAICERNFPLAAEREQRFIAGLSMGGYGALKAGLLAPDRFGAAASFSGALDAAQAFDRLEPRQAADIFGSRDTVEGSVNDLFAAAEKLARSGERVPDLYQWCGTEDFLYDANVRFREHAAKLGLPLTYEEGPGGHEWKYWDRCVERLLQRLPLTACSTPKEEE
ncbi:putative esterase [Paenibacillus mucilaginosus 3016]|uniref:Putative esterase n=1 Tax=Paenibacillus mucilaginosus 3016 TaxID=1116391 RepID=H6NM23_9BACL|nr:alpha/beta hydrolase family protein [Paenibacillus mucilaginosus]AFC32441.1 putative esterase [Paenibacillus mucilaginosus 3016]WFA20924.1 esterase family protein [Paenibacillus mucilaginosus]